MTGPPQPDPDDDPSGRRGVGSGRRIVGRLQHHERRRTALCVTILLGLVLLFYYRLWWPGLILIRRDAIGLFAPVKQYLAERLLQGDMPQWFPYEGLGRSFISPAVTGVFHFFSLLYLLLPAHEAYRLSVLLSCVAGAVGAYALARTLHCSRAGSMMAGIVLVCSGYAASLTENVVYLYSLCVMPWFCAALDRAVTARWKWAVAAAAVWASVFLNGDIQTGYYYGFVALAWCAMRAEGNYGRAALTVLGVTVMAALLAGVQLAPSAGAFLVSDRLESGQFHRTAVAWSTHPLRLLTMAASPTDLEEAEVEVAKFFFGVTGTPTGFMALSLYVGMPVTGLVILGGWYRRDLRGLVWLGCAALWLALGRYGGLYDVLYHTVPFWSAFRYPEKLMAVASLPIAMLAGAGLDECRRGRTGVVVWSGLTLAGLGSWGLFQMDATSAWMAGLSGAPPALAVKLADSLSEACLLGALATLGAGVVVVSMRRSRLPERILLGMLALVVTLDLSRVNQEAYRTGPAAIVRESPLFARLLGGEDGGEGLGRVRVFSRPQSTFIYPVQPLSFTGVLAFITRQGLYMDLGAEFRIESVNPYLPGYGVRTAELANIIWEGGLGIQALARFNAGYLIGDDRLFEKAPFSGMVLAGLPGYGLTLVKNPVAPSPRAYLSRRPERAAASVSLSALVRRRDFLSGDADVIEAPDELLPGASHGGRVGIVRYRPEEVSVGVETPTPAVLVLLDAFEAGWRASLEDGRELPIWRANALVRAVPVPAGDHQVTFTYRTPLLAAGAWCSFAGVLLCLGLWWHAGRLERRVECTHEPDAPLPPDGRGPAGNRGRFDSIEPSSL